MTTETGDYCPVRKKTATESEVRVRTGAVMTLIAVLVFYFSRYPYVLEATAAVLSIMGIVELLRAAGHCTCSEPDGSCDLHEVAPVLRRNSSNHVDSCDCGLRPVYAP